jgi:hypothetical protein
VHRPVCLPVLAIAIAACDGSAPVRAVAPPATVPSYDFVNGPEDPGPIVLRSSDDDFFLLFNTDRSSDLASLIRLPDPPGDVIPCGGTQPLTPIDMQLVFHAGGVINQLLIGREVRTYVYERRSFVAALRAGGICSALASQVPIAQGLVDVTSHDNDTFFSGTHADAFGWTAHGTLFAAADGAPLQFRNVSHGVLASDGSLVTVFNQITLTPSPAP